MSILALSRIPRVDYSGPPEPWRCAWDELRAALLSPPLRGAKDAAPLWSPGVRPGAPDRTGRHVTEICVGVLDVDDVPIATIETIRARLVAAGVEAVCHASHGAGALWPRRTKLRVVVRFAAPVPVGRWARAWSELRALVAPEADAHCRDPGRWYYLPTAALDAPLEAVWAWHVPGAPWAPSAGPERAPLPEPTLRVTREDLEPVAKRWARSSRFGRARLGRALARALAGEPFADPGERDTVTWQIVTDLVREVPALDPASLAELLAAPLSRMGPDAPTAEGVTAKATAARRRLETEAEEDPGDVAPHDPRVLVTSTGSAYYVRDDGERWRGPIQGDAVDLALVRTLGSVALSRTADGETRARSRSEIVRSHAETIETHRYVLGLRGSVYDPSTGTFSEAASPARDLEPTWSSDVDAWIAALAGTAHVDALRTWLALAPRLSEPVAALALIGRRGAGKSLLASGVARLWATDGPSDARAAFDQYNSTILRCPLIFADEALPKNASIVGRLKEIVQARTHHINQKYLPHSVAVGAIRLMIAGNDDDVLRVDGSMGPEDVAAIAERFYRVPIGDGGRAWLAAHPGAGERFVAGDEIAKHCLFLAAHWPVERRGRFWLEGDPSAFALLATLGGERSDVCRWIAAWSDTQRPPGRFKSRRRADGALMIAINDVLDFWRVFLPDVPIASLSSVRQALRVLSIDRHSDGKARFWIVDPALLERWREVTGWSTIDAPIKGVMVGA